MKLSGWSLRNCPAPAHPMTLAEPPSFSLPEGHKPGQTALLFIKQEEVLVVGKVSLAQQTSGCAEAKSTTQFLSRYNTPVSKENSWCIPAFQALHGDSCSCLGYAKTVFVVASKNNTLLCLSCAVRQGPPVQLCAVAKQVCAPQQCSLGCWSRAGCTASTAGHSRQPLSAHHLGGQLHVPSHCAPPGKTAPSISVLHPALGERRAWDPSVPVGLTQAGEELGPDIYSPIAVRVANSRRFLYHVAKI